MNASKPVQISFEQDVTLVNRLLEELTTEQAALVKGDIATVEAIIDRKFLLLQQLSTVAKNRYEQLSLHGFKQQANTNMQKAWDQFQKTLTTTKETNRLNGILINKHFSRNQQMLSQLQGKPEAGSMYGKNGQARTSQANQSVLMA